MNVYFLLNFQLLKIISEEILFDSIKWSEQVPDLMSVVSRPFAAREVVVSTLATIYNVESRDEDVVSLSDAMKNDVNPLTGKPVFTPLVALSLLVFYVYAAQCMATFAIVRRETNSWKWPAVMMIYMTGLAYLGSLIVYQGGLMLGYT